MSNYILYSVRLIKGILMYDWVAEETADNVIEAEHLFELRMSAGEQYVITIKKLS